MTELSMYWITRLDQIKSFLNGLQIPTIIFGIIMFIVLVIAMIVRILNERYNRPNDSHVDDDYYSANKLIKVLRWPCIAFIAISFALSAINMFVPTTKEIIAIKVIPQFATQENCQKLRTVSKDLLDITAKWLEDVKAKH